MLNYGNPTVNPDDMLNGSFTGPVIAPVNQGLAQIPRMAGAGAAGTLPTVTPGSSQAVLVAWVVLFVLLVGGHMLTLSVQR